MTVSLALAVVCVSVNRPGADKASSASVVAAMLTVALSPSRILIVASSAGLVATVTSGSSVPVKVTMTVSVPSTSESMAMPVTSMKAVGSPASTVTDPDNVV